MGSSPHVPLAAALAAAPAGQLFQSVLPWLLALIALAVVGALVLLVLRRLLRSSSDRAAPGFTLQGLRELRDRGELTEEEFERARQVMIERVKTATERKLPADGAKRAATVRERDPSTGAESQAQNDAHDAAENGPRLDRNSS